MAPEAHLDEAVGFGVHDGEQLHLHGAALLFANAAEGIGAVGYASVAGVRDQVEGTLGILGDGCVVFNLIHVGGAKKGRVLGNVLLGHSFS